jgi:hypothetical protein
LVYFHLKKTKNKSQATGQQRIESTHIENENGVVVEALEDPLTGWHRWMIFYDFN